MDERKSTRGIKRSLARGRVSIHNRTLDKRRGNAATKGIQIMTGKKSENSIKIDSMNVDDVIAMISKNRGCSVEEAIDYAVRFTGKRILAVKALADKPSKAKLSATEKAIAKTQERLAAQQAKLDALKAGVAAPTSEASAPAAEATPEPTKGKGKNK